MKISIVGTGMIATEVIKMLRTEAKGIEITSLFTHSNKEKAQALAKANHIERIYTDYTQLLREDGADFVYIALINSVHYAFVHEALEADRNTELPACKGESGTYRTDTLRTVQLLTILKQI